MKLDKALHLILFEKRMTPNALADKAGLRPNVVYSALKGGNSTMKTLSAIAEALSMKAWKIIKLAEEQSK